MRSNQIHIQRVRRALFEMGLRPIEVQRLTGPGSTSSYYYPYGPLSTKRPCGAPSAAEREVAVGLIVNAPASYELPIAARRNAAMGWHK